MCVLESDLYLTEKWKVKVQPMTPWVGEDVLEGLLRLNKNVWGWSGSSYSYVSNVLLLVLHQHHVCLEIKSNLKVYYKLAKQ